MKFYLIAFVYSKLSLLFTVEHAREAVLDSEALKIASKYATVQAQSLKTHAVVFDPHIFAEKLVCNILN